MCVCTHYFDMCDTHEMKMAEFSFSFSSTHPRLSTFSFPALLCIEWNGIARIKTKILVDAGMKKWKCQQRIRRLILLLCIMRI